MFFTIHFVGVGGVEVVVSFEELGIQRQAEDALMRGSGRCIFKGVEDFMFSCLRVYFGNLFRLSFCHP